ncbi:MAG: trypsin-like peptidase domain-containing protein [Opitutales bacterium]|jgi:S1-C subfamily serine protease|nr:trypsin-like peptidase domain-containing protein [Opitutales bacterium]MDP4787643.1 trypsin-like peptidase domain-containing protein [Opitutales bacterium]
MRSAKQLLLGALLLGMTVSQAAPVRTVTRTSETVDISRIRTYEEVEQLKLRRIWQAFKQEHVLTDDGLLEPAVPGADACPDNEEAQIAFLHHVKEHAVEVDVRDFIRCGDCNGTGKRYLREGDNLSSTALEHLPCAGTGKLEAIISYRLIYSLRPPARLPSKNKLRFDALTKRHSAGDLEAEFELGQCFANGRGTTKDVRRGCELLVKCLFRKDARAALALGQHHERGFDGIEASPAAGIAFYMLADQLGGGSASLENAYRNSRPAELMVGCWLGGIVRRQFQAGALTAKDFTASGLSALTRKQPESSAGPVNQQLGERQLNEGMAFLLGSDTRKPDLIKAYANFSEAGALGQADALFNLGVFHENGLTVGRSRPSAYIFYALAARVGGQPYMQAAETRLQPTCRSDQHDAMVDVIATAFRSGSRSPDLFRPVLALKDLDEPSVTAMAPEPIAKDFGDIYDAKTGLKLKPRGSGSGLVFTDKGHVFTNHHVVDKGVAFTVRLQGRGPLRKARLIATSEAHDLAILQIEDWKGPSETGHGLPSLLLDGAGLPARIGDRVFTIGFPVPETLNSMPKYTSGDVSTVSSELGGGLQVTCPIQPGNSGGPLVLESGHVAGVVAATMSLGAGLRIMKNIPQGVNFAVHVRHLRDLARRHSIDVPAPAAHVTRPVEQISAHATLITSYQ